MVSSASIAAMVFTMLVALLLPLTLVIILFIKKRVSLRAVLAGVTVFLVFQLLTRIPLINALSTTPFYQSLVQNRLLLGLFLGLTAGLFEEVGRYIAMRFLINRRWEVKNGVAFGLGHGGFEAFVLVGLSYINNLVYSLMINSGEFDTMVAPALGPLAETIKTALVNTPASLFLISGVERILSLSVQVALSLVVLFAVSRGKPIYLLYAILLHALVDSPLILITQLPNGMLLSEAYLLVLAVAGFVFILRTWKKYDNGEVAPVSG